MLAACWIHLYQRLLFVSDDATEAQFCDMPHVMILSDKANYYRCQDCLEPFFCAHCIEFALLSERNNTMDNNYDIFIYNYLGILIVF